MSAEHEGTAAWREGIQACIRKVRYRKSVMPDLTKPAYAAALDDLLIHFEAMLERGTERSTTPIADFEILRKVPP